MCGRHSGEEDEPALLELIWVFYNERKELAKKVIVSVVIVGDRRSQKRVEMLANQGSQGKNVETSLDYTKHQR